MRDDFWVMVEFLRGRLSEDETLARTVKTGKDEGLTRLRDRFLADIEAKRRLVDWVMEPRWRAPKAAKVSRDRPGWQEVVADIVVDAAKEVVIDFRVARRVQVVYELVAAYANHPDFRPEWLLFEDKRELDDEYEPGEERPSNRRRG
ncbi:DUF6221 family protein [Streptomyces mirabilis]|uniref:DUF6221 family protein n=1 Tax=Streptomyces mirabilis TaxID=68239 RepID=UPI00339ED81E